MTVAVYALLLLLLLVGLSAGFVRADPTRLADGLRKSGPLLLGIFGALLLVTGRAGVGGALLSLAFGWYGYQRKNRALRKTPGKRSTVRTAALEMELDHDSGALEGMVLAGRFETSVLGEMTLRELVELHAELLGDGESRQLLETYLDGRFPVWRKDAEADVGRGQRVAPGSGAMTKQEAYQVLGLETGASAADVRKAHRRLMQRLHPDVGGSPFLAARINEAKDVLLSDHD